jgi:integrase
MENTDKIIDAMNKALNKQRMYQKELYEHLIAEGEIKPNSEKEFKNLYNWALSNGFIDRARIKNWNKKKGKLPKYFTKKQLIKIFEVVDRPKDMIACFMALMCGMRINEICTLKIKNIDFESHRILIEDSKNPNRTRDNYGKDRYVDFDPAIDNVIKKWLEIIGYDGEWFIPSDKSPDMHLRKKSLHERFRMYLKEAGLLQIDYTMNITQKNHGKLITKKVNRHKYYFHCLRHTMASIIYNKTGDIYAVNRFLGHNQLDTTAIYAKMIDTKMKNTISDVFASLHYNYHDGQHLPNPKQIRSPPVQSQPIVPVTAHNAMDLLETQFVNGDISETEFLKKKQILRATELKKTIELKGDQPMIMNEEKEK